MKISAIAAMGRNREIGKNNDLLWHIPRDMKFFKETTRHKVVIMGRKNYESIPPKFRPLPDRVNIIISRNPEFQAPECYVCTSLKEAILLCEELGEDDVFIIGGAQIYALALEELPINTLYITHVDATYPDAEAYFPDFNQSEWKTTEVMNVAGDDLQPLNFNIVRYDK